MRQVITIETSSLGDRSYIVHDGSVALVVDPPRDVDRIVDAAAEAGVEIVHIVETHLHNDYVSGGLTLSRITGATYSHAADEDLAFEHNPIRGGDEIKVGQLTVEVVHTPGHTQHHLSYVVHGDGEPPAAFTGGSLLLGSVGRTDLLGEDLTEELTRAQFRTAQTLADLLPDDAEINPTHGFGSFCASASSGEESDGSLRREREINLAFTAESEDAFVDRLLSGLSDHPAYYAHMAPMNRAGASAVDLSPVEPVDPAELKRRIHRGEWVVDLRDRVAYAGDHLTGTIGIQLADGFSNYLGWLIPWGTPLTLLADSADDLGKAQRQLARIGIDRPGTSDGGVEAHADEDRSEYRVVDFTDVAEARDDDGVVVLDVRRDDEWSQGHIEDAVHIPIHQIVERMDEAPDAQLWVHCASGFRASIAASLLARAGHDVVLINDDYGNAAEAGIPIVD